MQKLAEHKGTLILDNLKKAMSIFLILSEFLRDFNYVIDELNYQTLKDDYLDFALDLSKTSILAHSLGDPDTSLKKLTVATFVSEEISYELYHSLKFSNDTQQSSSHDTPTHAKRAEGMGEVHRIRSFTFDMSQRKLAFDRRDEITLAKIQGIIRNRSK